MPRPRIFAAPLVVTLALAPACSKETPPEPKHVNPPALRPDAAPAAKAPDDGSRIVVDPATGECWQHYRTDCDPGVKCNPPDPRKVPCPGGGVP